MVLPQIIDNSSSLTSGDLARALFSNLPPNLMDGMSFLISLGKAIGIAVLVYVVFLIVRTILQIRYNLRFKYLVKNVEEINNKMDNLIGKKIKRK